MQNTSILDVNSIAYTYRIDVTAQYLSLIHIYEEIAELFVPVLKEHGVEAPFEKVVTVVGMMKDRVSCLLYTSRCV